MKLERIVLVIVWLMLAIGLIFYVRGGVQFVRSVSQWIWLGAFGILCLPLLVWLVHFIVKGHRD